MNSKKIIDFLKIIGKLKRLNRSGWVLNKIKNPESVAEHSFRTAFIAMILAPEFGVDELKSIKMALIHDVGEAEIGDIVIGNGSQIFANKKEKDEKEKDAVLNIFTFINGEEYLNLFDEFVKNETKEAKFIRQIDKIEMVLQALEYEEEQQKDLTGFFENTELEINDSKFKEILNEIKSLRKVI